MAGQVDIMRRLMRPAVSLTCRLSGLSAHNGDTSDVILVYNDDSSAWQTKSVSAVGAAGSVTLVHYGYFDHWVRCGAHPSTAY